MVELPKWSDADLVVMHGPFRIGIFPNSKPWFPRHKARRMLGLGVRSEPGFDRCPNDIALLPSLKGSVTRAADYQGTTVRAGEAEGHTSAVVHGGGDDWTVIFASDAWIAVGPTATKPDAIEIGPHAAY